MALWQWVLLTPLVVAHLLEPKPPLLVLRGGSDEPSLLASLKSLHAQVRDLQRALHPLSARFVDPQLGDLVSVRATVRQPSFDWGNVTHTSVGRLVWFDGEQCAVDFPQHYGWLGRLAELERVQPSAALADVGDAVRVRRNVSEPALGWGGVDHDAVGTVERILRDVEGGATCHVRFDRVANWTGLLTDLEVVRRSRSPHTGAPRRQERFLFGSPLVEKSVLMRHVDGAAWRRDSGGLARRLGWALGIALAQLGEAKSVGSRRGVPRQLAALPRVLLGPLVLFGILLGCLLSFASLLLDRPVSSMLDSALEVLPTLFHALQGRSGRVPGLKLPRLSRALLLAPLRLPSVLTSSTLLFIFCVRPTLPNLMRDTRRGFEEGFRQLRSARGNSWPSSSKAEAMLGSTLSSWRRAIALVQAARAATIGVGLLMLLEWALALNAPVVAAGFAQIVASRDSE